MNQSIWSSRLRLLRLHAKRHTAITGVSQIELREGAKTLLLGWSDDLNVFAGFDATKHQISMSGRSPSIQIKRDALEKALKKPHYLKGQWCNLPQDKILHADLQKVKSIGLAVAQVAADELNDLAVNTDDLRKAVVKLVAKAVLKLAAEQPEQLEQMVSLTKLLLESESNDIRRSRLKLAEQYFHFEATAASLDELPKIRAYLDVIGGDTSLTHEEKIKRVQMIIFGWKQYKKDGAEPDKSKNGS